MGKGLRNEAFTELSQGKSPVFRLVRARLSGFGARSPDLYAIFGLRADGEGMSIGETAQFFLGATVGLAVIFAALVSSTASIRAGEKWESNDKFQATAFASFAGITGITALAGIVYGLVMIALHSPLAS